MSKITIERSPFNLKAFCDGCHPKPDKDGKRECSGKRHCDVFRKSSRIDLRSGKENFLAYAHIHYSNGTEDKERFVGGSGFHFEILEDSKMKVKIRGKWLSAASVFGLIYPGNDYQKSRLWHFKRNAKAIAFRTTPPQLRLPVIFPHGAKRAKV